MAKFADLLGTIGSYLKIGASGVRLKNSSGNLLVRNTGDTGDASVTASLVNVSGENLVINSDAAGTGNDRTLTLARNASQGANLTITFPSSGGTAGQAIITDGSGGLSYASIGGSADKIGTDTTSLAFGSTSPVTMFTLPANAVVEAVRVIVDTSFNGTPSLSIGVSGTTSKYMASSQVDLTAAANTIFEVYPGLAANGSTEALIATYSASGASAGAARIEVDYCVPT